METKFNVVFSGQLQPEVSLDDAVNNLVLISNMPTNRAEALLSSGKPVTIKKGLSRKMAEKYHRKLSKIGLQMRLVKVVQDQTQNTISPISPPDTKPHPSPETTLTQSNLYAAPKANLTINKQTDYTFLSEPQKVTANHGWKWIKEAFNLFRAEPWKWIGMSIVMFLLLMVIGIIPIIGSIINQICAVVLGGGLLIGAHSLREGEGLDFGHLFSGLNQNRNQLILAGVYYLLAIIIITFIAFLPIGSSMWSLFVGIGAEDPEAISTAMGQNWFLFLISILIGVTLYALLMMSFWFVPSLIAIAGTNSLSAFKLSFKATKKNILPFLVYGLLGLALMFVLAILSGVLVFLIGDEGFFRFLAVLPIIAILFLGLPIITVIMGLSVYTSFRDIFYRSD